MSWLTLCLLHIHCWDAEMQTGAAHYEYTWCSVSSNRVLLKIGLVCYFFNATDEQESSCSTYRTRWKRRKRDINTPCLLPAVSEPPSHLHHYIDGKSTFLHWRDDRPVQKILNHLGVMWRNTNDKLNHIDPLSLSQRLWDRLIFQLCLFCPLQTEEGSYTQTTPKQITTRAVNRYKKIN